MPPPVVPPVAPMLAKATPTVPIGDYWYEPKWDGFRVVVFRDGDDVVLGSRNERPLTRYFPDVVATAVAQLPRQCVVDGEIVVAGADGLDFDALSQRIHPAESRVRMLAESTPASLVAFDLLALGERDLRPEPFSTRRGILAEALSGAEPPLHLTPVTRDPEVAATWFERLEGAGLDGVVAKRGDTPYLEDQRVMLKVKHERTAEFVVAGFRWYKGDPTAVGSLMLGLYDGDRLQHVGVIGSFTMERRRQLVGELEPHRYPAGEHRVGEHRAGEHPAGEHPWAGWATAADDDAADGRRLPGATSRWNAKKDLGFELLAPELVVEAAFEHLQGARLRHTARFRRWRPERDARSCTYTQVDVAVPTLLADVFRAGR